MTESMQHTTRWHINPETGLAGRCRAKKACKFKLPEEEHFASPEEALLAYAKRNGFSEAFSMSATDEESTDVGATEATGLTSSMKPHERASYLREIGLRAVTADEMTVKFYHSTNNECPPSQVTRITADIESPGINKPKGALWLSSGLPDESGRILTDWNCWAEEEGYMSRSDYLFEMKLRDDAVVVEVTSDSHALLPKVFNREADAWKVRAGITWDPGKDNVTPWLALREAGVSAVRVNGATSTNGPYYGYSVDSLIILDETCVQGWQEVEKMPRSEIAKYMRPGFSAGSDEDSLTDAGRLEESPQMNFTSDKYDVWDLSSWDLD